MKISEIINILEDWAPAALQESYDNAGLLTGDPQAECAGAILCLDITQKVLEEALEKQCNLIIAHHPLVFKPLKSLATDDYVSRTLIFAIRNNLALYALHTNLDNVLDGVNKAFAKKINLSKDGNRILLPKRHLIAKLTTYVPKEHFTSVQQALFKAGAGHIGLYENCSFYTDGTGTFRPMEGTNPFIGSTNGPTETVTETKLEMVFPVWLQSKVLKALNAAHPYETVAYEILQTQNVHQETGSGLIGTLQEEISETSFLAGLKDNFQLSVIKTSPLLNKKIKTVALCGGAGSFLIAEAIKQGADVLVTSDLKYHDYFEADGKILLIDIGHYESEVATIELMADYISSKFPNFAVLKTKVITNPVQYFT